MFTFGKKYELSGFVKIAYKTNQNQKVHLIPMNPDMTKKGVIIYIDKSNTKLSAFSVAEIYMMVLQVFEID